MKSQHILSWDHHDVDRENNPTKNAVKSVRFLKRAGENEMAIKEFTRGLVLWGVLWGAVAGASRGDEEEVLLRSNVAEGKRMFLIYSDWTNGFTLSKEMRAFCFPHAKAFLTKELTDLQPSHPAFVGFCDAVRAHLVEILSPYCPKERRFGGSDEAHEAFLRRLLREITPDVSVSLTKHIAYLMQKDEGDNKVIMDALETEKLHAHVCTACIPLFEACLRCFNGGQEIGVSYS